MGETISFEEFCAILQNLIGRVVEQSGGTTIVRRGKIILARKTTTRGAFAKTNIETIHLSIGVFEYWDNQNKEWTQAPPRKLGSLMNDHVPLFKGPTISRLENGTILYGTAVRIYPNGAVPEAPTVT